MPDCPTTQTSCSSHRDSPGFTRGEQVRARNAAFTLLELLVVVLIIGILTALLSTAFNKTKGRSHKVSCLGHMRQLQIAWQLYVDDNEDLLPLNRSVAGPLSESIFGRRNTSNSWVVGNPKEDLTTANIASGTLFPYVRSVGLYRCPADRSTVIGRKAALRTRSYSMSAYLNGDNEGFDPRVKTKFTELINPSPDSIFVFVEEHESSPWAGSFQVAPKERLSLASATWSSTPSDRHNQGGNISFVDGHVEHWKWYCPKEPNVPNQLAMNAQQMHDLRRLQAAIPRP
jgi:prepilin-type processing-associated H-X9-DG protein/prepilin-type N-terminal cleavage/methylation domain-containing protein